ncbi:MAG: xylulose kinase [Propionibacteriaceae bacterium]|nr:xylulose kinase [Propionibacteriaceae bacterium]
MALAAGIDSSTQSCKIVIRDSASGELVRSGRAPHPDGTEVHPDRWWEACQAAAAAAGGLEDVAALAVGGQQHGMVCLDEDGEVVRPALLWNDTRSAAAAADLVAELGGGDPEAGQAAWAAACGSVPVASLTVAKLRWLAEHEPAQAARVAAVCLPHDWLSWRLAGHGPKSQGGDGALAALATDRSDASGTGYWSPRSESWRLDLLKLAFGAEPLLPAVAGPDQAIGETPGGAVVGPGAGDNAAAALGLGLTEGDVAVSIGTSGVVSAVSAFPTEDPSGLVTGFADAAGAYLPLACTLNGARILDGAARLLGVDHAALDRLALDGPAGADGLVLVPYLEGERTPNKPQATGSLHGLRLATMTPVHLARAAVESLLCLLADCLDAMTRLGVPARRITLIGGGAKSEAVRRLAPAIFGLDAAVPPAGEYVADGAARQAAWVLDPTAGPPLWERAGTVLFSAQPAPRVREHYAEVRDLVWNRPE